MEYNKPDTEKTKTKPTAGKATKVDATGIKVEVTKKTNTRSKRR